MRRRRSLGERVVWAVTMTVALFLGLQSVVAFVTLHAQEDDLSDTMLQREVQQIVAHILQPGLTPTGTLIDSTRVSAWLTRDGAGGADIPPPLRRLAPGLYQLAADHKTLHVAVTDTEEGRLTVVLDATSTEARVYKFGYTLLALWLICVAATIWIARGVAAITVGPLVAATRNIARSAPDEALPEDQHADEAGLLMETFNRFRDRADEMVEREREFAANLDHEIRTPLTAIRTDAELIGMEADLGAGAAGAPGTHHGGGRRDHRDHRIDALAQRRPGRRRGDRSICATSWSRPATRWPTAPMPRACASPSRSPRASWSWSTGRRS